MPPVTHGQGEPPHVKIFTRPGISKFSLIPVKLLDKILGKEIEGARGREGMQLECGAME